ncbi:MAG: amino acid ABC transporter ATP-binding protein [Bacilli bacterium]|nr:amino acid ABC transporter ATP-binding protein [Bacilli bacterium]
MDAIRVEHLIKEFDGVRVLNNINISFEQGSVTTIIGPSGSGKSTLLRCINQLETATSGHIYFEGNDLTSNSVDLNKMRAKIGMVFQSFNLFNNMSVLENCIIGQVKVLHRDKKEAIETAKIYLEKVGMLHFQNRKVTTLSGGQKQRVAIARTLAMNPAIILLDEPTSSLDPEMVKEVLEVLKKVVSEDYTFIVVTHEMDFAKEVSDRIVFMENGEIIEDGSPNEIWHKDSNIRLKRFLNI